MAKRRRSRVPGMVEQSQYAPRQRRYGVHFHDLAERKGWKLQEGERVVAALPVADRRQR